EDDLDPLLRAHDDLAVALGDRALELAAVGRRDGVREHGRRDEEGEDEDALQARLRMDSIRLPPVPVPAPERREARLGAVAPRMALGSRGASTRAWPAARAPRAAEPKACSAGRRRRRR